MSLEELEKKIDELIERANFNRKEGLPFADILDRVERLEQLRDDVYGY